MRAFKPKIEIDDPDVTIAVSYERENEIEQSKFGDMHLGTFTIEEAEALVSLLKTEIVRAKNVHIALVQVVPEVPGDGSL